MDADGELKLPAWGGSRPPPCFARAWHMGELAAINDGELGGSRSTSDHNLDVLQDLDSQGSLCGQPPGRRRQPKEGFLRYAPSPPVERRLLLGWYPSACSDPTMEGFVWYNTMTDADNKAFNVPGTLALVLPCDGGRDCCSASAAKTATVGSSRLQQFSSDASLGLVQGRLMPMVWPHCKMGRIDKRVP
ncbi:uncharacterized protein LOC119294942 isoform X2 [Triticum dicoccoides]|uniref:uncharacterized protein LOC119294942 isoform X2 n=1 Tax=Triticum dicoccoides TaxID=85692 RepID=UPI0018904577|nr:uncharacterized protein LOC119294942 isoform X2 [Triticum dicoccoides]